MEGRIGARLLNRATRSLAPSASGELLNSSIAPLFRKMTAAVADAGEATGQMCGAAHQHAGDGCTHHHCAATCALPSPTP
ncbi:MULTISPECIES: hypothetical protein [Xanthomonas]|uniref:hypothetical protein n=1 Tax=Xanthomonas TaxID=338 RepID=UPI000AA554E4|nr:hypothetical protein [Xanthomonas phaseoli]